MKIISADRFGSNFPKIIKNTSATIFIRGCFGIARILLLLLIARKFGPNDFGALSLALSVVEIFKVVADFGADTIILRRFVINKLLSRRLLGNVLTLKILSATIAYILANVLCWLIYRNVAACELLLIVAASIYTTLFVNAFVSYFQANLNTVNIIVPNVVSMLIYASLTLFGFYADWSLAALVLIIPLSELINLLATAKVYSSFSAIRLCLDKKIIWSIVRDSIPVGIAGIIVVLYSRLDILMIEWFLDQKKLGEYAFAYRMTEPFLLLFSSLSISVYAFFSGMGKPADLFQVRQKIMQVMTPVVIVSGACALFLSLSAKWVTKLISNQYAESAGVLPVLAWAIVFKAINAQLTAFINSRGKYRFITIIAVNNLIINVILNLLLIPRFGLIGAALAVVLTEAINTVIQSGCIAYLFSFSLRGARDSG